MIKVLIIDDSWIARLKIGEIVKSAGYEVLEAGSGEEGLALVEKENPHVLLLDLLMPGLSGHDVLQALGKQQSVIPVIIISADIQETTRAECLRSGAAAFVNKPPKRDVLLSEIQNALDRNSS